MINFDYITLTAFLKENIDYFIGARLQKIQQPTRRDFLFTLRKLSETRKLYVNINPSYFHFCFVNEDSLKRRDINFPKQPPMFCMLLRKYLDGACIIDIRVPDYERILELDFKSNNEFNENTELTMAIEMMGKYSNIILYNSQTKIILGCAHNVGADKSREREVSGTLPYIYPPKQNYKTDILRVVNKDINYNNLNKDFLGISKSFENLVQNVPLEKIKDYVSLEAPLSPSIDGDKYSVYSELLENPINYASVNKMLDEYYSLAQQKVLIEQLYFKLKNIFNSKYKKLCGSLKKIQYQISKKDKAENYKKYGDLILSNLYNSKDYSKSIKVTDWETSKELEIKLDETQTLKENAQRYYHMYNKSKLSRDKLEELESSLLADKEYLEQIKYTLENANNLDLLREIEDELSDKKTTAKNKESEIEQVEINGFKVFIGKNNRQNDLIISKLSRGEDYWFHAHNMSGSHVLLKVTDSNEPDENVLFECCKIAKKYSSGSNSSKVGVIYTKRKYVKKPPAANLGYVIFKNEKEVIVD